MPTPYKFNAKELDQETGMYYYGARYYTPELSVWLSVDPLSDKYPSLSSYSYCAGNPMKYIDPNGMEVEHSTFKDKLHTSTLRIFSSTFRNQYRILKKSTETYVFQGFSDNSNMKDGEFTTDGNKLFISYNFNRNESEGTTWTNHLKHESEHAVQFEHGEFGFIKQNNKWSVYNFDLSDEKKARDVGYSGFTLNRNIDNSKNRWNSNKTTDDNRYEALINVGYNGTTRKVNTNMFKIKTENTYMMPYRKR